MSTKKLTNIEFINRCKLVHSTKYDYSDTYYVNMATKVTVKCNTCLRKWEVLPGNHIGLRKSGCPVCKLTLQITRNKSKTITTSQFILRATKIHNCTYDYTQTSYINSNTKVTILCKIHGAFQQWPNDHINGAGCSKCSGNCRNTTEQFINKAKEIFPNYDYSLINYKSAHTNIDIICPEHGIFQTKPNSILNKVGCGKCSVSRQLLTKIMKGIVRDPNLIPEYEKYRRAVWKFSNKQYNIHHLKINPTNIKRGVSHHLDHKYSIQQGFQNNIPPHIIGSWVNLQIIPALENRTKTNKCSISKEVLMDLFTNSN